MLPASNRGVGMNMGFPDVCNTPVGPATVPIPYPNIGLNAQAVPFSPVVKVSGMNALNMASKIPLTSGDEAGVAHPTIKGPGSYVMGNPIVHIDRMAAINLTCPTTGNNMNDALGAVLVPSAVNVFYCWAAPGTSGALLGRPMDAAELEAHPRSLAAAAVLRGAVLPGALGHLAIGAFTADLSARIHREIRRLEARGARALILDLRGCPGGEMEAAIRLADDFLPRGAVIARTTEADGDEIVHAARQGDPCDLPLVVLVDSGTASAAELFAGSLQASARAVLVGETTYGKGLAQRVIPTPDGVVYATVSGFLLPDGRPVAGAGVTPDLEVSGPDAQLDAAQALLLEMLAMAVPDVR